MNRVCIGHSHIGFVVHIFIAQADFDINQRTKHIRSTLFQKVTIKGLRRVAEIVFNRGDFSSINVRDAHRGTALHCTAWLSNAESYRAIVRHPRFEAIKAMDSVGKTALHYVAEKGALEASEAILQFIDVVGATIEERKGQSAA